MAIMDFQNRMKARQFPKLAHARETLNTVSVKRVRGKNGIIREEHDLLVLVDPVKYFHFFFKKNYKLASWHLRFP